MSDLIHSKLDKSLVINASPKQVELSLPKLALPKLNKIN